MSTRIILVLVLAGALVLVLVLTGDAKADPALPADQVPGEPPPPMGIPKAKPIPIGQRPQVTVQTSKGPVTLEKAYEMPGFVQKLGANTVQPAVPAQLVQTSTLKLPGFRNELVSR